MPVVAVAAVIVVAAGFVGMNCHRPLSSQAAPNNVLDQCWRPILEPIKKGKEFLVVGGGWDVGIVDSLCCVT